MNRIEKKVARSRSDKSISRLILFSIVGFSIGYYMLNHIATWENPPMGNTFHIVIGCALIAISLIFLAVIIRKHYFPKKKRKKSHHVFLDNNSTKKEQ